MEQLGYLFTHNQPHSYSELNSLVEEVMNMHQKFIQSDEEMIKSYGIEQERLLIESRMMRNWEEGIKRGKLESAKKLIEEKYHQDSLWIESCSEIQIESVFHYIIENISYHELKNKVCCIENEI